MRKFVSALAVAAGLALLATPANAQDYPPGTDEGLTVSESTVAPGESITVSGDGAEPGATVTVTLTRVSSSLGAGHQVVAVGPALARLVAASRPRAQGAVTLGRTTADDDGSFSTTVTIPSSTAAGVYTLSAISGGEVLSVATIRVTAASGGLPFTGADVAPGLVVGAGLIVAGGLLLLAVRRRRRITT